MKFLDFLFRGGSAKDSLHNRIRTAQTILVVLMLIPAVVSISLMMVFSTQYHFVIAHMEKVSSLMPLVRDELLIEMSDIVVGRTPFDDGKQYDMLDLAREQLDALIESDAASRMQLKVAGYTLGTLRKYIDTLGVQMRNDARVDENMYLLGEIQNVGMLFIEMLQDSINADILAAADASDQMQSVIRTALWIEILLLLVTLVFAVFAQQSLSRSIRAPIEKLKAFAGRIAGGELSVRTEQPNVEELQDLTANLNTMAFKLQQLIKENTQEQQNLKKSELRALQAQIAPHFLYNTLDAIIWLAESKRYSEVIHVTGALSNFYRTSLNNGRDWITIDQEREHLEGYLTILRVRYRDILKYQIDIDERLKDHQILKLLIQPLVENALYHGIKNRRGGGLIKVSIQTEGERMRVTVSDDGAEMEPERLAEVKNALLCAEPLSSESGYGLLSVDRRIKLYYNQPDGLSIDSAKNEGTKVSFVVPVKGFEDVQGIFGR